MIDLAGKLNIFELAGFIRTCDLFVSSDTGPYHMAVGLRTPTLAVFNLDWRHAFHQYPWVRCIYATNPQDAPRLMAAADELLRVGSRMPQNVP